MATKVPHRLDPDRNDDGSDDVTLLALAQRWPPATWRSLLARALYQATRARSMADRSDGRLTLIETRADLEAYLFRRLADPAVTAAFLAIEGAHALDGDPANVDRLADAGYRMMSPTHFFDNAFGGSAHGVEKGGLTAAGREMVERMEARSMIVDVAHASPRTIDDVLAIATRPIVASHTGVRAGHDSVRNLADDHVRGIAATGGLVGIGFWPTACGGDDAASIARAIRAAVELAGIDHVGLGSDFDGAVPVPVRRERAWSSSRTPSSPTASPTTRSRRSWAATRSGSWPRACPPAEGAGATRASGSIGPPTHRDRPCHGRSPKRRPSP